MNFTLPSDQNIKYNIEIRLISECIVFQIKSDEIPKKVYCNHYTFSDMKNKYDYFSSGSYQTIESIFKGLQNIIKKATSKKLDVGKKKIELKFFDYEAFKTLIFEIEQNIDINESILEISTLYKDLKLEKDKEIKDFIEKNKEYEQKMNIINEEIDNLKKEINNLNQTHAEEIDNLKDDFNEKINNLKDDFNEKINNLKEENEKNYKKVEKNIDLKINFLKNQNKRNNENLEKKINIKIDNLQNDNEIKNNNLKNDLNDLNNDLNDLNKKMEKYFSFIKKQILFLVLNNHQDFLNVMEAFYQELSQDNIYSNLFGKVYKSSYNDSIQFLYKSYKGINGKEQNKILEFNHTKYEEYDQSNWNAFLMNNVIYQMLYSDDISLNKNGVDQILEKIFKFKPFFTKYKTKLEESKRDIKVYLYDYKLYDVIRTIKNYISSKNNFLSTGNEMKLLTD